MAITHARINIGTVATQVSSDSAGKDGQTIAVQNPSGADTVYLGGANVTTGEYGFELVADTTFTIEMQNSEKLFGITTSGQTVNVIRQGA